MDIECCIDGNISMNLLLYITSLATEKITEESTKYQDLLFEIYKHLKYCDTCEDYYASLKRAILAKDYNDYINKFGLDWSKKSFKLIRKIVSEKQLRLLRQNEKYLEGLIE